jgi:signal transduction histidine kinase/YHS domain-containing protein
MKRWSVILGGLLAGSVAANVWGFWRVLHPIQRLSARAKRLAQGEMNALEQSCGGIHEMQTVQHTMRSMAAHVQRAQLEGLSYRHALTDGQEAERARIAHELHDDTVQALVAIAQSIDLASSWLDSDPQRARTMLAAARTQAIESVSGVRRLIADLRPPALEELGVSAALRMLAETAESTPITVAIYGDERRIGGAHELALFRIAQEAVRNSEKHAQPTAITLDLTFETEQVRLIVRDDGQGIQHVGAADTSAQQFGLIGMRERAEQGMGTVVEVRLPLDASEQPTERVRDPVCGAVIEPHRAFGSTVYEGQHYYFCCPVCQGAFQRDPSLYMMSRDVPIT